jgi:hypothetical protein
LFDVPDATDDTSIQLVVFDGDAGCRARSLVAIHMSLTAASETHRLLGEALAEVDR